LNALLSFYGGVAEFSQPLTVGTANTALVPANPGNLKLIITAATGLFTGSFTVTGEPVRKADVFGVLLPLAGAVPGRTRIPPPGRGRSRGWRSPP